MSGLETFAGDLWLEIALRGAQREGGSAGGGVIVIVAIDSRSSGGLWPEMILQMGEGMGEGDGGRKPVQGV